MAVRTGDDLEGTSAAYIWQVIFNPLILWPVIHQAFLEPVCVLLSSWDSVGKKGDRGPALLKLTFQRGRQNDVIAGEMLRLKLNCMMWRDGGAPLNPEGLIKKVTLRWNYNDKEADLCCNVPGRSSKPKSPGIKIAKLRPNHVITDRLEWQAGARSLWPGKSRQNIWIWF